MEPVWALIGVFVGGIITWFVQWDHGRRDRAHQERLAAMQIALQLRTWLREATYILQSHSVYEGGNPGDDPSDATLPKIPSFPFEQSLSDVSRLSRESAKRVFGLVENLQSAWREAEFSSFVADWEAVEYFDARVAGTIIDAATVYADLATWVGWNGEALPASELEDMRKRASKLNDIRKRASNVKLQV